jgi:hypothetical protein
VPCRAGGFCARNSGAFEPCPAFSYNPCLGAATAASCLSWRVAARCDTLHAARCACFAAPRRCQGAPSRTLVRPLLTLTSLPRVQTHPTRPPSPPPSLAAPRASSATRLASRWTAWPRRS